MSNLGEKIEQATLIGLKIGVTAVIVGAAVPGMIKMINTVSESIGAIWSAENIERLQDVKHIIQKKANCEE